MTTLHGHNEHVTSVQWNANGNWLLSASRDQSCKARLLHSKICTSCACFKQAATCCVVCSALQVWDLRMLKELSTYRGGHTRDVACAVWHPVHEELFCSGSHDGSLVYWLVSRPSPQASLSARRPRWSSMQCSLCCR